MNPAINASETYSSKNELKTIQNQFIATFQVGFSHISHAVSKMTSLSKIARIASKIIKFVQIVFGEEAFPILELIKTPIKAVKNVTSTLKIADKTHDLVSLNAQTSKLKIVHKVTSFAANILKTVKFFGSLGLLDLGKAAVQIGKIPIFGVISQLPLGIVINVFQFVVNVLGAVEDAMAFFSLGKKIKSEGSHLNKWNHRSKDIEDILYYVTEEAKLNQLKATALEITKNLENAAPELKMIAKPINKNEIHTQEIKNKMKGNNNKIDGSTLVSTEDKKILQKNISKENRSYPQILNNELQPQKAEIKEENNLAFARLEDVINEKERAVKEVQNEDVIEKSFKPIFKANESLTKGAKRNLSEEIEMMDIPKIKVDQGFPELLADENNLVQIIPKAESQSVPIKNDIYVGALRDLKFNLPDEKLYREQKIQLPHFPYDLHEDLEKDNQKLPPNLIDLLKKEGDAIDFNILHDNKIHPKKNDKLEFNKNKIMDVDLNLNLEENFPQAQPEVDLNQIIEARKDIIDNWQDLHKLNVRRLKAEEAIKQEQDQAKAKIDDVPGPGSGNEAAIIKSLDLDKFHDFEKDHDLLKLSGNADRLEDEPAPGNNPVAKKDIKPPEDHDQSLAPKQPIDSDVSEHGVGDLPIEKNAAISLPDNATKPDQNDINPNLQPNLVEDSAEIKALEQKVKRQLKSLNLKRDSLGQHYRKKIQDTYDKVALLKAKAQENELQITKLNAKLIKWENIVKVISSKDEKALQEVCQHFNAKIDEKNISIQKMKQEKIQKTFSFIYRIAKVVLASASIFLFFSGVGTTAALAGLVILTVLTYSFGVFKFFWNETHKNEININKLSKLKKTNEKKAATKRRNRICIPKYENQAAHRLVKIKA